MLPKHCLRKGEQVLFYHMMPGRNPKDPTTYRNIDKKVGLFKSIAPLGEIQLLYLAHGVGSDSKVLNMYYELAKVSIFSSQLHNFVGVLFSNTYQHF